MAAELILRCEHCRDQFQTEPVPLEDNGEVVHLCSFTCWIHWFGKIYHTAMASGATVQVTMKGEKE